MPPLLQRLSERQPESLDYLGVSYGLTPQLLRRVYIPLNFGSVDDHFLDSQVLEASWVCPPIPPPNGQRVDGRAYMCYGSSVE